MKRDSDIDAGVVYSTETGRSCPKCQKRVSECECGKIAKRPIVSADGFVRLRRETKGRKGKGVVVISGLSLEAEKLKLLAKELKKKCGSGGSIKDGAIEIQGDHLAQLTAELKSRGFKVK